MIRRYWPNEIVDRSDLIFKIVNTLLHTEVSEQKLNQQKFCVWKLMSARSLNVAKI